MVDNAKMNTKIKTILTKDKFFKNHSSHNNGSNTFQSRAMDRCNHDDIYQSTGSSGSYGGGRNKKDTPFFMILNEDMRISKILYRLNDLIQDGCTDSIQELCVKLETAVRNQANANYICRSFDNLADKMVLLLKRAPSVCIHHIAVIFGLMGYVNRADFPVYKNFIVKNYNSDRRIQKHLMLSLKTTISCDAVNKDLLVYSERILIILKEYLENSDIADNFMAVCDTVVQFSKHYKSAFEKHFPDIVDIIVGWHLETEQSPALKHFCSMTLQKLSEYFIKNLDFTLSLLGQFLEDIQAACDDICSNKWSVAELNVGAFVGAFNSVMKSLANHDEFVMHCIGKSVLTNAIIVVTRAAKQTLKHTLVGDVVHSINEFFTLVYENYAVVDIVNVSDTEEILQLQIINMDKFNQTVISSCLFLTLTVINQLKANTPIQFVTMILESGRAFLCKINLAKNDRNYKLLLKIYHEILMIRNVPLLLEAYRHIVDDIVLCMSALDAAVVNTNASKTIYTVRQAEYLLTFNFTALANLATETSSLIGMYALKPSILDLLLMDCKATDMKLWSMYPVLHSALLNFLRVHCQKNHNYRMSPQYLTGKTAWSSLEDSSPTAKNFFYILEFFVSMLEQREQLSEVSLKLILDWLSFLFEDYKEHVLFLKDDSRIIQMCRSLCRTSNLQPVACAKCIDALQKHNYLNDDLLREVRNTSIYHMQSLNPEIRDMYSAIFGRLPLRIALINADEKRAIYGLKHQRIKDLQHWYISTAHTSGLKERFFTALIEEISYPPRPSSIESFMKNIFSRCWMLNMREKANEYYRTSLDDFNLLMSWIQWEAATYCVKNKLRTKYGKPQHTFLKIESIIMEYLQILALKSGSLVKSEAELMANRKCARLLLGFLDCLEKSIYNAAEGTAFALQAPEKHVKVFFRVNTSPCKEWFSRITTAVSTIALHCDEPALAIHYLENRLKAMLNAGKITDPLFEQTVGLLAEALLKSKEADTLVGLYCWLKLKTGKRYQWIKHIAEQASGRRELAAKGYSSILLNGEKLDTQMKKFLTRQLMDCLHLTNQWDKLKEYLANHPLDKKEILSEINMSWNQLETMENLYYDHNADISVLELSKWENLDNPRNEIPANFSYQKLLGSVQSTLTVLALNNDENKPTASSILTKAALQECFQKSNSDYLLDFIILNHVATKLDDSEITYETFEISRDIEQADILTKCIKWAQLFARKQGSQISHRMLLDVAFSARMDGNLILSRSELERFFQIKRFGLTFDELVADILSGHRKIYTEEKDIFEGYCETARCLYADVTRQSDALALASACCLHLINIRPFGSSNDSPISEIGSDMFLTLSEWFPQQIPETFFVGGKTEQDSHEFLRRLMDAISDIWHDNYYSSASPDRMNNEMIPPIDMSIGKLILAGLLQGTSASRYAAFGNWCYKWGKRLAEAEHLDNSSSAVLSSNDVNQIKEMVSDITEDDIASIINILDKHQITVHDDEEIETSEASSTELIEKQLREIPILVNVSETTMMTIIQKWRHGRKSAYLYFEMASQMYIRYLLEGTNVKSGDCSLVTAALRLLRLLVKHVSDPEQIKELQFTLTGPWELIVPQLFSRLSHHTPAVRKFVSDLLCRVAKDAPHLIIFPAVVGAFQEDKKDENGLTNDANPLKFCFNSLLSKLSSQAPETVQQVQLLVKELKRVALLWHEFWAHSLSQLCNEYMPIINSLELEAKKNLLSQNYVSFNAKQQIVMQHISEDFKKLFATTSRPAETNYEKMFQDKYSAMIESTMEEFSKPVELTNIKESWLKVKQLNSVFQQRLLKMPLSPLRMADISPVLANMHSTTILMPGVETTKDEKIFIEAVDNRVFILPTKTKPKKLVFFGSNGKKYTYLFKGLEDLHLDERIMQFLSISNSMMARSRNHMNVYRAHHYSVIPLGPQSGMISWVDGVTPLFSIYKKWQQREATVTNPQATFVYLPSEMFYSKLRPLLAAKNIKITDSRKTWPLSILRQVLNELMRETPRDLLSKELWCHSPDSASWRSAIRKYSLSVAVMSVIGYVIGLGDRHLANVLVNLSSGEIVHIDYNVCFEKGKTLRVPENVPFRMTQNLEDALGITGIEGTYRLACEHVMKILRKERETLLTLLEAFVYDPLVDWTVGDDGIGTSTRSTSASSAAAKISALKSSNAQNNSEDSKKKKKSDDLKKNELEVTKTTILTRFTEIKPTWIHFRDDIICKLQQVVNVLKDLEPNRRRIRESEIQRDALTKQLAMIRELESLGSAMGSHALNTISQRYETYKTCETRYKAIKKHVEDHHSILEKTMTLYIRYLLDGNEVEKLQQLQKCMENIAEANEFDCVKSYLNQTNQSALYEELVFAHKKMDNFLQLLQTLAGKCVNSIAELEKIMRFYPRTKLRMSRFMRYEKWYRELLEGQKEPSQLKEEVQAMIKKQQPDRKIVNYASLLDEACIKEDTKLLGLTIIIEEMKAEPQQDNWDEKKEEFLNGDDKAFEALVVATSSYVGRLTNRFSDYHFSADTLNTYLEHIQFLQSLSKRVFAFLPKINEILSDFNKALLTLKEFHKAAKCEIPSLIVEHFMREIDDDNLLKDLEKIILVESIHDVPAKDPLNARLNKAANKISSYFREVTHYLQNIENSFESKKTLAFCKTGVFDAFKTHFEQNKRDAVSEMLVLAKEQTESIFNSQSENVYDVKKIGQPLVEFIKTLHELCTHIIMVIGNLIVEDIFHRFTLKTTKSYSIIEKLIPTAQKLLEDLYFAHKQSCDETNVYFEMSIQQEILEHMVFVTSAYFWTNEVQLQGHHPQCTRIIERENFLTNLMLTPSYIGIYRMFPMDRIQTEIAGYTRKITNILEEAAKERPDFIELKTKFLDIAQTQVDRFEHCAAMREKLIEICTEIHDFKKLQTFIDSQLKEEIQVMIKKQQPDWKIANYARLLDEVCIKEDTKLQELTIIIEEMKTERQQDNWDEKKEEFLNGDDKAFEALVVASSSYVGRLTNRFSDYHFSADTLNTYVEHIQFLQSLSQRVFEFLPKINEILSDFNKALLTLKEFYKAAECEIPSMIVEQLMRDFDDDNILEDWERIILVESIHDVPAKDPLNARLNKAANKISSYFREITHYLQNIENSFKSTKTLSFCNTGVFDAFKIHFTQHKKRAVSEMLVLAKEQTESIFNSQSENVYDVKKIGQPLVEFIKTLHELCTHIITRIDTLINEDLVHRFLMKNIESYTVVEKLLPTAQKLLEDLYFTHKQRCDETNVYFEMSIKQEILEHMVVVTSAYFWTNEAQLQGCQLQSTRIIERENFLTKLMLTPSKKLIEICTEIHDFEKLQTFIDGGFIEVIVKWEKASNEFRNASACITSTEQAIVQLLNPEGVVDQCWIDNISGLIDEMTFTVHKQIADLEKDGHNIEEQLLFISSDLQSLMDTPLRVDIRQFLKLFSKLDNCESQCTLKIHEFQNVYREFFNQLNDLNMKIICKDFTEGNIRQMFEQINDLIRNVEQNHTDLIELVEDCCNDQIDRKNLSTPNLTETKRGSQHEQKRNVYAVSVWKRIRMKLEGRDPDPNRRLSVVEQIDYIIREATNSDNLAVLYEGWTPWV